MAPRAPRNCAPSAPWAGASVRPLNFTVRHPPMKAALPPFWRTKPLPQRYEALGFQATYNDLEVAKLKRGFMPRSMDDKWFIYFADGWLYFHRSWTGTRIYWLRLEDAVGGLKVAESYVNREPREWMGADTAWDLEVLNDVINNFLLGRAPSAS